MTRVNTKELREMPLYSPPEAAHFLRLPVSTVRAWAFGQTYEDDGGKTHRFKPVINVADRKHRRLSFLNLVELSVLAAIRRIHKVSLPHIRDALSYLRDRFPTPHPLADHKFQTDGMDLLVDKFGQLLNVSKNGQIEMKQIIAQYLRGVERDAAGVPIKLHLPRFEAGETKLSGIVIDPKRGFGRPIIDKAGIRTEIVIQRFRAGEAIESLAEDYALDGHVVEDLIRDELPRAA